MLLEEDLFFPGNGSLVNMTLSTFCEDTSTRSALNLGIGALLTVGTCISYLPQHVSLIRSRSVKGMSWPWLFLSCVASFSLLVNVVCLRWSDIRCCESVSAARCQVIFLPVYQVGVGILNTLPIFLAYQYLRVDGDDKGAIPSIFRRRFRSPNTDKWSRNALFFFVVCYMCPMILTAGLLIGLVGDSLPTISFGATMGGIASIASILMWLPQIVYTIRTRDGGSLSLLMLCIQMPGALAAVYFQAIVEQEGITTFGPYLAGALEQFALIFILVYFRFRAFRRRRKLLSLPTNGSASSVVSTDDEDWQTDYDDDDEDDNGGPGEHDELLAAKRGLVGSKSAEGFAEAFVKDGI